MREYRFRAWDKGNKEWINLSEYALVYEDGTWTIQDFFDDDFMLSEGDDFELVQNTGLHDKHGKDIWEGDIALTPIGNAEIRFAEGAFWLEAELLVLNADRVEIIGNIYEHPELLTNKEEK